MLVVGQIDDLAHHRHLTQKGKGFGRAVVVEGFHDIIGDEGHRWVGIGQNVVTGSAQGKISVVAN